MAVKVGLRVNEMNAELQQQKLNLWQE